MSPIEVLMNEHRAIERMLKILTRASDRLDSGKDISLENFEKALDFIRNFADRCHHMKEEDTLFPVFHERGLAKEGGPIGVMLQEHERGRNYVRNMRDALEKIKAGDKTKVKSFVQNARGYIDLLTQHIQKEDNILYPMGDQMISDEDRRRLLERFEEIEQKEIGEGVHERYHHMIEELEKDLGIT